MSLHRRVEARDRGLRRVSRLTSLTLTGGLAMSGGLAAVAAHAYAGHSRRSTGRTSGTVTQPAASTASGGSLLAQPTTTTTAVVPLGAPQTAPQTAPSTTATTVPQTVPYYAPVPPPVVSGGS